MDRQTLTAGTVSEHLIINMQTATMYCVIQSSEALVDIFTGIKQAVQSGKYNVAARYAEDFIKMAYYLQSKRDMVLGKVLEGIYVQIHREMVTHAISDKDMVALHKLMMRDMEDLMSAYTANGDVYKVLNNMHYNATAFQHATAISTLKPLDDYKIKSNKPKVSDSKEPRISQKSEYMHNYDSNEYETGDDPYNNKQNLETHDLFRHMTQAIHDIQKSLESVGQDVEVIKNDVHNLLHKPVDENGDEYEKSQEIIDMPVDKIKELILSTVGIDNLFYPSDIAMDHNLDYDAVMEAVDMLRREGRITE